MTLEDQTLYIAQLAPFPSFQSIHLIFDALWRMSFFITDTKVICFSGCLRWQKMSPLEALKVTLVTFWMIAQINRYCVIVLQMYYTTERGRWTIKANKKQQTFSHKGLTQQDFVCANLAQHSLNSIFYKSVFSTTLSSFSTSLALVLYELLLPLHTACAVFLVSPSDCCFACPATADQYPALCVWRARRHRWNNNRLACLYRTVSQLVPETQETQCKTIIYNNTASRQALRWWSSFM